MKVITRFIGILIFASLCILTGCRDKSVASSENLRESINDVIRGTPVYIAITGMSTREGSGAPPFVVLNPISSDGKKYSMSDQEFSYLTGLLRYSRVLEKAGAIKLEPGKFVIQRPFIGRSTHDCYEVIPTKDILRTISPTPFQGLMKAMIGTITVDQFTSTSRHQFDDGVWYIDVTFTVKLDRKLDCVDDNVLFESGVLEVLANSSFTYRLYLDERKHEWTVLEPKPITIDTVRVLFKKLSNK
ncbi:MAG: hypothetical protein ACI4NE_04015 [Succinivibrio sp.]